MMRTHQGQPKLPAEAEGVRQPRVTHAPPAPDSSHVSTSSPGAASNRLPCPGWRPSPTSRLCIRTAVSPAGSPDPSAGVRRKVNMYSQVDPSPPHLNSDLPGQNTSGNCGVMSFSVDTPEFLACLAEKCPPAARALPAVPKERTRTALLAHRPLPSGSRAVTKIGV